MPRDPSPKSARIFALEGPSGVGKTTVAREWARRIGAVFLPEAAERMRPRPSLRYATRAELERLELRLVEQETLRYRHAQRELRGGRSVVADTGFLGPLSYSAGLAALDPRWDVLRTVRRAVVGQIASGALGMPDRTFYLDADERTLRRRAAVDPARHPPELTARHWRVAAWERRCWQVAGAGHLSFVNARGVPARVIARLSRAARAPAHRSRATPYETAGLAAALSFASLAGASESRNPWERIAPGNR